MVKKSFFLLGQPPRTSQTLEVDLQNTFEYLQYTVAQKFSIAEPSGESAIYELDTQDLTQIQESRFKPMKMEFLMILITS